MKSEYIYDAITNLNDELVDAADKFRNQRKRNFRKQRIFFVPIALVTAAAILVGIFFWPNPTTSRILKAYAIEEANYPEMVQYPKDLSESDPFFYDAYEEWSNSLREHRNRITVNYSNKLKNYTVSSIREFLSDSGSQNRSISPLNIYMALSMLAEITDGNSREQLLDLLGCSTIEELRSTASNVWNANYRNDGIMTNILASSLWLNDTVSFNPATMKTLANTYYASSYQGEMGSPEFDTALQNWLNEQTGGLLEEQVSGISLNPRTIIALATTVHFQAKWDSTFAMKNTTAQTFHTPDGDISTDFMHRSVSNTYYWGDKFSAVSLPFAEGGQMKIILPDEGYTPEDLLSDNETLNFMADGTHDAEKKKHLIVNLAIPKFDISSQLDLSDGLKTLGITDVFDPTCSDYSPLTTGTATALTESIHLSQALHGTRVTIDEEGCTAAAYTMLAVDGATMPPEEVDFIADRPFLFVISYRGDLPLFAGVVNQP